MKVRKGITRIAILVGWYAIKLPRLSNGHLNFLHGCLSNYGERDFYKKCRDYKPMAELIAPSYFCTLFGLVQIQKRCVENKRELTEEELLKFECVRHGDKKPANFGYIDNRLVCLDYY